MPNDGQDGAHAAFIAGYMTQGLRDLNFNVEEAEFDGFSEYVVRAKSKTGRPVRLTVKVGEDA